MKRFWGFHTPSGVSRHVEDAAGALLVVDSCSKEAEHERLRPVKTKEQQKEIERKVEAQFQEFKQSIAAHQPRVSHRVFRATVPSAL
jgi:hypothetical protein